MPTAQEDVDAARKLIEQVREIGTKGLDDEAQRESRDKMMAEAKTLSERAADTKRHEKELAELEAGLPSLEGLLETNKDKGLQIANAVVQEAQETGQKAIVDALGELVSRVEVGMKGWAPIVKPQTVNVDEKTMAYFAPDGVDGAGFKAFIDDFVKERGAKALGEGTAYTGAGVLVVPDYQQAMFAYRRIQGNALRRYGWLNMHTTASSSIIVPQQLTGTATGWVAEGSQKPTTDPTFGSFTVAINVLAGMGLYSTQLLADADPSVQDLIFGDLAGDLGDKEEIAIWTGSGSGQPLGILNTPGIPTFTVAAAATAQIVFDAILDCIVSVQTSFKGWPTGMAMTPKRLAFLRKGKDSSGNYLLNPSGSFRAPGGLNPGAALSGDAPFGSNSTPTMPDIWEIPIGISTNIPSNLGAGTNQDVITVANWDEAHWWQRQEVQQRSTDSSDATFDFNRVKVRLEERAGFSAQRYPTAFAVLGGPGLV